jgi:hypothetical protein
MLPILNLLQKNIRDSFQFANVPYFWQRIIG